MKLGVYSTRKKAGSPLLREILKLLDRNNVDEVRVRIAEENREMERMIVKAEEIHIRQLYDMAEKQTDPDESARYINEAENREHLITKAQEILRGVGG